ncbi:MAG: hypothetical protein BWY94_01536 [Actinobacteria bacterium ADurb.BinA094]|nr:MAG: hypothetical protein BWY94_01536 [Actinobacteria bacterium ADurb.BinA094]
MLPSQAPLVSLTRTRAARVATVAVWAPVAAVSVLVTTQ